MGSTRRPQPETKNENGNESYSERDSDFEVES